LGGKTVQQLAIMSRRQVIRAIELMQNRKTFVHAVPLWFQTAGTNATELVPGQSDLNIQAKTLALALFPKHGVPAI
jgi:hypothetical protein